MSFPLFRLCITILRFPRGYHGQPTSRTVWPMTNFQLAVCRRPQNYSKIMKMLLTKIAKSGDVYSKIHLYYMAYAGDNGKQWWLVISAHRWGRRHREHRWYPVPVFRKCGRTRANIFQNIVTSRADTLHRCVLHGPVLALCSLIAICHSRKLGSADVQSISLQSIYTYRCSASSTYEREYIGGDNNEAMNFVSGIVSIAMAGAWVKKTSTAVRSICVFHCLTIILFTPQRWIYWSRVLRYSTPSLNSETTTNFFQSPFIMTEIANLVRLLAKHHDCIGEVKGDRSLKVSCDTRSRIMCINFKIVLS